MKQRKCPHPVILCWVLSFCPHIQSSIHPEWNHCVSWCSNMALLFLALEKICSSSQIKPELIRIIGMYYMNSIFWWIFPSTPCWKGILSGCCSSGTHVKLSTQLKHLFFLMQSSKSSCFQLFISPSHETLVYWKGVVCAVLCCSISCKWKFKSIMFAHWNCWVEISKDWYI